MLQQAVGDNDGWRLYGEAPATNQVRMVFELVDDIEESLTDQWVFRNKRTYTDFVARNEFNVSGTGESYSRTSSRAPIFYDSANTAFYGDFAGTSVLNGLTVTNTITGSITGNAGTASALTSTTNFFINRGNIAAASIDTATGLGVWNQLNVGDSHTILAFGASGSTSTVQQRFHYTGSMEFRNQTDSANWTAWKIVLTSANYTSYSPSLTGSGASGNWAINVTGNAATVTNGLYTSGDQFTITGTKRFYSPNNTQINTVAAGDRGLSVFQETASADAYMTFHVSSDYAAYFGLGGAENDLVYGGWSAGANRHRILHSGNYTSWAPSLTGGGASGTWGISVTGNAATITNQQNSATIEASTGATANHIVRRDANGYIYANYINFNQSETENPTISSFLTSNGDGWARKSSLAHAKNSIRGVADGTWGINISGSAAGCTFSADATNIANIQNRVDSGFYEHDTVTTAEGWPYNGSWMHMIAATHSNDGNYFSMQIAADFFSNNPFYRSVNNSGGTAWSRFALYGNNYGSTLYATQFIDSNNTERYVDPDGTSVLNTVSLGAQTWRGDITWNNAVNIFVPASAECSFDVNSSGVWQVWDTPTGAPMIRAAAGTNVAIGEAGSRGLYVYGAITATDNITAYSDIRIKRDIYTIENALEKTLALRGVTYYRTDDRIREEDKEKRKVGVIAQEVEQIIPEVVREDDDGFKTVDYGNIVGLLIEAIKEQQTHINNLQEQINSIQNKRG
jgi:hypothetical protein